MCDPLKRGISDPSILKGGHVLTERGKECLVFNPSSHHTLSVSDNGWIFDCGAADTMFFDPNGFLTCERPNKNIIKNTNGEGIKVEGVGTISFSKKLTLNNCLFVPALSHKFLSVSQHTRDLNCTVLKKPGCCIAQDAQIGKILGCGTERGGLYYVDEATTKGHTLLARGSLDQPLWCGTDV